MVDAGEVRADDEAGVVQGDALRLPFADATFDRVIASEVLEHIPEDDSAMAELSRVLRPGGTMAVTVPRFGPEAVNWALSDEYHDVPGGHVRIYRRSTLVERLRRAGLRPVGQPSRPRAALPVLVAAVPGRAHGATTTRPCAPTTGSSSGTSCAPRGSPGSPSACSTRARQEPRRLPGEARMTRTEGTFPMAGRVTEAEPELVDRPWWRRSPRSPACSAPQEVVATAGVDRRGAAPRRDDPVVRGRPLRPVEPRRGGHGPDAWPASTRRPRCAYQWLADTQLPDGSWFNYYLADAG